jgi:hypothetical protein
MQFLQVCLDMSAVVLPVLADDEFLFPSDNVLRSELAHWHPAQQQTDDAMDRMVAAILTLFHHIAIVFQPQNYSSSSETLKLRAQEVARRLEKSLDSSGVCSTQNAFALKRQQTGHVSCTSAVPNENQDLVDWLRRLLHSDAVVSYAGNLNMSIVDVCEGTLGKGLAVDFEEIVPSISASQVASTLPSVPLPLPRIALRLIVATGHSLVIELAESLESGVSEPLVDRFVTCINQGLSAYASQKHAICDAAHADKADVSDMSDQSEVDKPEFWLDM